ncbi:MAG: hypothetical protein DWQ34_12605 [Planctomycetota bacterium]|nr:MAG: hypothetical protein DWQ34_12605 [Planctomycetota bacterium]REJ97445.1 MAG: hypothetical protein DWQ29_00095 [Planctomycetota bacterium]REK26732.1 MAG: hypothetical protein DWQ41_09325 [Planctomycetota bacterium]REK35607.1 MAG: hypothetical protein DWQ45_10630 [Planctomycetota bacterium]
MQPPDPAGNQGSYHESPNGEPERVNHASVAIGDEAKSPAAQATEKQARFSASGAARGGPAN